MNIDDLIGKIENCDSWHDDGLGILIEVHNAMIAMGTFDKPLDPELKGIIWGQWQMEVSKSATLAVLKHIRQMTVNPSDLHIFAIDLGGDREEITDFYWFEENFVHDLVDERGIAREYQFEIVIDSFDIHGKEGEVEPIEIKGESS